MKILYVQFSLIVVLTLTTSMDGVKVHQSNISENQFLFWTAIAPIFLEPPTSEKVAMCERRWPRDERTSCLKWEGDPDWLILLAKEAAEAVFPGTNKKTDLSGGLSDELWIMNHRVPILYTFRNGEGLAVAIKKSRSDVWWELTPKGYPLAEVNFRIMEERNANILANVFEDIEENEKDDICRTILGSNSVGQLRRYDSFNDMEKDQLGELKDVSKHRTLVFGEPTEEQPSTGMTEDNKSCRKITVAKLKPEREDGPNKLLVNRNFDDDSNKLSLYTMYQNGGEYVIEECEEERY